MNDIIRLKIIEHTGAQDTADIELIQPLWSNYGTLSRVHLLGGRHPSVVVKHIEIPNRARHPRGFTGSVSRQRKIKSYSIEANWYQVYNPIIATSPFPSPICLAAVDSENTLFLILEDLSNRGFTKALYSVSWDDITVVLSWLAYFHAQFLNTPADGLWSCGSYWHLATRPEELAKIQGTRVYNYASFLDERLNQCPFQTLVHGDAKLANFLFLEDHSRVAAVDFQYVGKGCGMKDVAYFIGSCLSEDECQRFEADILDYYFGVLTAQLSQVDIDVQALEKEWRLLYPVAWADFYRFMLGWSPNHRKMNHYSHRLAESVLNSIENELLELAKSACIDAGKYIKNNQNQDHKILSKGMPSKASDVVSQIDLYAQEMIVEALRPSFVKYNLGLLAEEGEQDDSRQHKHAFWTIDPLDGTQFYIDGHDGFAVSIALVAKAGHVLLGVVYDPVNNRLYHAVKDKGFYINNAQQPPFEPLSDPTTATKWFADRSLKNHPHFEYYNTQFDIQFIGGAVMNVLHLLSTPNSCYCKAPKAALGGCAIWDLAAVSLMVHEFNGTARFYNGERLNLNRAESLYFNDVGFIMTSPDLSFDSIYRRLVPPFPQD